MVGKSTVGLSRLVALRHELDALANNIANQTTVGFKAKRILFREYLSEKKATDDPFKRDPQVSLVQASAGFTDFSDGALKSTGSPLDVAIVGEAFFVVKTAAGERYTRDGAFKLDGAGRLVTSGGDPVLTTSGPITLSPQDGEAWIAADGTVLTAKGPRGQLRLVRFADPQTLRAEGGNLFGSSRQPTEIRADQVRLAAGVLETSNVQPALEMSRVMEVTRAYDFVASAVMKSKDNDELKLLSNF